MTRLVLTEGNESRAVEVEAFLADNADSEEVCVAVRALRFGQIYNGGGGAAPAYSLRLALNPEALAIDSLVLVEACGGGRQIARFLGTSGDRVRLTKWRAQGQCWTQPALYQVTVLVERYQARNADHARRYRAMQRAGAFDVAVRS